MKHCNFLVLAIVLTALMGCDAQKKSTIKYLTISDTSGKLMNEDVFWDIIEKSRAAAGDNYQAQVESLKLILSGFKPDEIEKFNNTFNALLAGTYDNNLWGASYVINGGCSDDCFDYFREYLIAHGKERFYETIQDPETCVNWIKSEEEDSWEGIRYSAMDAYKLKTGNELPESYQANYVLKGEPFNESTLDKKYPKLTKRFFEGEE